MDFHSYTDFGSKRLTQPCPTPGAVRVRGRLAQGHSVDYTAVARQPLSQSPVTNSVLLSSAATAMVEGKVGKSLKKVLKKVMAKEAHEQLAISDVKLGGVIKVRRPNKAHHWVFVI